MGEQEASRHTFVRTPAKRISPDPTPPSIRLACKQRMMDTKSPNRKYQQSATSGNCAWLT
eukprot:3932143-Amphidinium_carterae.1